MLLSGLEDHDRRMEQQFSDPSTTTAVLWPGEGAISPEELVTRARVNTGGRIALVAIDATWNNANRMKSRLPKDVVKVGLPPSLTMRDKQQSLFHHLRKYKDSIKTGRVSTVEAVASMLYHLEGDEAVYSSLMYNLKLKVDGMRSQRGRPTVYGVLVDDDDEAEDVDEQGCEVDTPSEDQGGRGLQELAVR